GLGGRQLRARGLGLQALVARIELGQHLAGAHVLAGIDVAPRQVAADTERERAFLARADLAGIGRDRRLGAAARLYDEDRTRPGRFFVFAAAGRQQAGQREAD